MLWVGVSHCPEDCAAAEAAAHLAFEAAKEGHRIVALVVAMLWLVGGGDQGRHAEVWVGLPDSLLEQCSKLFLCPPISRATICTVAGSE